MYWQFTALESLMRRLVPFVGEHQIARAEGDQESNKRTAGRVIDEVVSTVFGQSSWDDLVPSEWPSREPEPSQPSVSISLGSKELDMKQTSSSGKGGNTEGKTLQPRIIPPRAHIPASYGSTANSSAANRPTKNTAIAYSDKPSLEWVLINNGRGLRITVSGNIDHSMRPEWRRLLEETEASGAGEYEFNLSHAPALSLTGLGMLLLFKERKGSAREAIKLCNCSKDVAQLLRWTGMEKYFVIQSNVPPNS
jgi:anti-anti-sigma factor